MNSKYAALILSFLCLSCNTRNADGVKTAGNDSITAGVAAAPGKNAFRSFVSKFRPVSLPLSMELLQLSGNGLPLLFGDDTLFIGASYKDTTYDKVYAYGVLPDTVHSFKVIWLSPAEVYIPILATYSKSGRKISEDYLGLGGCGSDCCFSCKETIYINADYTIYSADSIRSCECDSAGPNESTMRRYVRFKTAKIEQDGKVRFSAVEEKEQ